MGIRTRRVSGQVAAVMSRMGRASSQHEDLSTTVNRYLLPQVAAGRGAHDVHMDVGETFGWDGDGLHRRRGLPGNLGSLTLLAVLDPCGHVAVATASHNPGGDQPLGGPRAGVG